MIIDGCTFLGDSIQGYSQFVDELLARLDACGVDRAVVCPVKPYNYDLGPENDHIAEAVANHPDRLIGFARVDPRLAGAAVAEAERALGHLGLRGLFLHPWEETVRANDPLVVAVVERAVARGAPVLIASGYPWVSEALQVADLARRFPEGRFIMTNGGQINISGLGQQDAFFALEQCPNLLVQTAGTYRQDFLEEVVARFGAARLLYASNAPLFDPRLEIERVRQLKVAPEARAAVAGGNLAALLGLS